MGIFMNTISILKKNFYPQDTYYSVEIVIKNKKYINNIRLKIKIKIKKKKEFPFN
jgi:hypothetical protein